VHLVPVLHLCDLVPMVKLDWRACNDASCKAGGTAAQQPHSCQLTQSACLQRELGQTGSSLIHAETACRDQPSSSCSADGVTFAAISTTTDLF
jgi:hypothetical protein